MVEFEVPIYVDTLSMLFTPVDLRSEVKCQLMQGDPAYEDALEEIGGIIEDREMSVDHMLYRIDNVEKFMEYVSIDEEATEFDYSEADAADDRRLAVFRVYCSFDVDEFIRRAMGE